MTDTPESSPAPEGAAEWDDAVAAVSREMGTPVPEPAQHIEETQEVEVPPADPSPEPAAGADAPPADPWGTAPPELRAAYDALMAERDTFKAERDDFHQKWKSDNGRIAAYKRELAAARSQTPPAQPAPPAGETAEDPMSKAEAAIAKVREDFPEIADTLAPLADALKLTRAEIAPLRAAQQAARAEDAAVIASEQEAALAAKHPDWQAVADAAFVDWAASQPKWVQDIMAANAAAIVDADGAALVLDRYKQAKGIAPQQTQQAAPAALDKTRDRRARQLAGSASPAPRGAQAGMAGLPPDSDPAAMFDWAVRKVAQEMGR
jgi:hypothetical protein